MSARDERPAPLLEVACFDGKSGITAAEGGADRIEYVRFSSPLTIQETFSALFLKLETNSDR